MYILSKCNRIYIVSKMLNNIDRRGGKGGAGLQDGTFGEGVGGIGGSSSTLLQHLQYGE